MFDNLRDDAKSNPFYEDNKVQSQAAAGTIAPLARSRPAKFLGMTAQQRFIIVFMMMIAVCVLGVMFMLITGRFGLY
jgi:uncharacterized oligopeptide transporter (OPT) family protein